MDLRGRAALVTSALLLGLTSEFPNEFSGRQVPGLIDQLHSPLWWVVTRENMGLPRCPRSEWLCDVTGTL